MKQALNKVVQDKRDGRAALAQRSFSEKVAVLEKLRERNHAIAANPLRSAAIPPGLLPPSGVNPKVKS